jgi:hypothetical protein
MTPQEKQLLERFLADMTAARAGQKDPEAEALIREAAARQPDAAYLLVQRALQLDQVLQMREAEVQKLQEELARAKSGSGGSGFLNDAYAWGSRPTGASMQTTQSPGSAPIPGIQPQGAPGVQAQAVPQQQPARPWGGSSMLGTVAGAAAGVVAGGFLYQGINSLMHRNDPPAGSADHSADQHGHGLLGDSTGFENIVPDDSDTLAAGDADDSDAA